MRNHNTKFIILLLIFGCIYFTFSQDNQDTYIQSKDKDSSLFVLSSGFISDTFFLGKKDSINNTYLHPSIMYYNKLRLYATGSFSYLTKSSHANY